MKQFSLSDNNVQPTIFWWLMAAASFSAVVSALYDGLSFTIAQFAALFVAFIVSALVNQHQFTIPQTKIKISANELIVFWGIIWLGTAGSVLLAACLCAATWKAAGSDKKQWLFNIKANIVSAFAAGSIFYSILKYLTDFTGNVVAGNAVETGSLVISAVLMAFVYCAVSEMLKAVFLVSKGESSISGRRNGIFVRTAGNYLFGLFAAFVFHFAFLEFGLTFGLVILPVAVFAHLGYRIHITSLAQKTREISEASRIHLATVEALATAIDARDQVGVGHVRRTQIYAVGIGRKLNLAPAELEALNTGALLHDIGKLAVPDHILNKPGRLTPAEMEKTKIHAVVGASILEKINFNCPVVPTVKYHHEMWDGSGYPEGLAKEEIPLTARILTIADAYDALRGARPFRPAVSREESRRFLTGGSGKQFDPKLVDVFLRNLREFETEVEEQGFSYTLDGKAEIENYSPDADLTYVEQIKRANREVFTLYELARVFSSSLNLQETLALFVKKVGEFVPFDSCVVYLLDEAEENARAVFAEGVNSSVLKEKIVKAGEGASGYVLKKRQAVHKIEPGLDFSYNQIELVDEYTAMASLPLIVEEKLLGAVSLYSCELENYEEEQMRLLETVSRIASDAISMALRHAESESRALTDPMTGLPNARSLQMQFENEAARANRNGSTFHVLMLDLDGFKAVNDTFGHKIGDKMLREISKVMRDELRDYDFLARYAGDEFLVVAPETDKKAVSELCQRIEKAVSKFILPVGVGEIARVGVSVGAACFPIDGETLDQIVVAADKAMYRVKAERKEKQKQPSEELQSLFEAEAAPLEYEAVVEDGFIVELDESHVVSAAIN